MLPSTTSVYNVSLLKYRVNWHSVLKNLKVLKSNLSKHQSGGKFLLTHKFSLAPCSIQKKKKTIKS